MQRTAERAQPKGGGSSTFRAVPHTLPLQLLVLSRELIPAKQLNLPHPEHFDPRSATRLDPASDANPPILERFYGKTGSLERRVHAP